MHHQRVWNPVDEQFHVERVGIHIVNADTKETEAARYRVLNRGVIGDISLPAAILYLADEAVNDIRGRNVCRIIGRAHLD